MREPGKVGALTPRKALILAGVWAVVGVVLVVLSMVNGGSLIVGLIMASAYFVVVVLMLVVWRIARRRAERDKL
ncbi:hypothetical protein [Arthrobacter sp. H14]|uniref:hypothetical protein n=1 Tax=Arthrobacter sp. H14 TaxID=1312959 RepID=UPI00047C0194|nr:hypothetical protein [Arthrobacter sp. H14]